MGMTQVRAAVALGALCLTWIGAHATPHRIPLAVASAASAPAAALIPEPLHVVIVAQPPVPESERRAMEAERAAKTASDAALVSWTEVLGVATLILALGTLGLLWATRRLVLGADKTAERQLRSYVFVTVHLEQAIAWTPSGNVPSPIVVRFANHGSTPAQLTRIRALAQILQSAPAGLPAATEDEIPSGVALGPQYIESVPVHVRVSNEEWGAINRGDMTVYCFGCIEYEDVLGVRRETGFCWELGLHGNDQVFSITPNKRLNYRT